MFSMTKKVCTTFPLLKIRNSSSKKIVVIPKFDHEKLEVLEDKAIDGLLCQCGIHMAIIMANHFQME
jgi:hypothetical protein